MGIVSFSHYFSRVPVLSVLLTPLQILAGLFKSAAPASGSVLATATATKKDIPCKLAAGTALHACDTVKKSVPRGSRVKPPLKPPLTRLKIVRQLEPGASALCAGRMTISGSMADVCAELDRMAQREAITCSN